MKIPVELKRLWEDIGKVEGEVNGLNFYLKEDLEKLNDSYRISEFAPGALLIGSDGGGEGIVLDMREGSETSGHFYFMPFIPLGWKDSKYAGASLDGILNKQIEMVR